MNKIESYNSNIQNYQISDDNLYQKTYKKERLTFEIFRDTIWKKISHRIGITIKCANIILEQNLKVLRVIKALGLAVIINAILTLSRLPEQIEEFVKNISLKDIEGIFLKGLDLISNPADALDSITSFVNTLSAIEAIPVIGFFSIIALPLGITLLSYKILKVSYQLVHLGMIKHQTIKKVSTADDIGKLKAYLEKKLTVTAAEKKEIQNKHGIEDLEKRIELLKSRKINQLTRRTDKKIVNLMQNLLNHINNNENDLETANHALSDMHTLLNRKITYQGIGLGADLGYLAVSICSIAFPVLVPAVSVVAVARQMISLKLHDLQKGTLSGITSEGVIIKQPNYERYLKLPKVIEEPTK